MDKLKLKKKKSDNNNGERDVWDSPVEFFLTMLGYSVGPGNIIRFPYLCMQNGGAAFLIPYFICLFVCGIPLFFMELVMGQSTQKSCVGCWSRFCPLAKGVGYTMLLVTSMYVFEYQTVMAWILYYFGRSFTLELPWASCNHTWNTPTCIDTVNGGTNLTYSVDSNASVLTNWTLLNATGDSAVEEFFQHEALRLSSGIDEVGGLIYPLIIAHIVSWIIIFFCVFKGIRSAGKVVWISATLPYVVITIFLIRAALLPGFMDGIRLYTTPNFTVLKRPDVWMLAFLQIFYSLGPGWGQMISMSSHNRYHHNFIIEAILCPLMCCFTSFYAGFVTFGVAGFLAYKKGLPVEQAMKSGPGIAFISYPELATHLPGAPIWSALFFFMMANVLLTTMITMCNTIIGGIHESLKLQKNKYIYLIFGFSLFNLIGGLIFYTNAGMYYFQLFDWYFAALTVFFTSIIECICVVWLYGFRRLYDDIFVMIGRRPFRWIMAPIWGVIVPVLLSIGIVWSGVSLPRPTYGKYSYPDWCVIFGWTLAASSLIPTFVYLVVKLVRARGPSFWIDVWRQIKPLPPVKADELMPMNHEIPHA